jgi:hypothetical protein
VIHFIVVLPAVNFQQFNCDIFRLKEQTIDTLYERLGKQIANQQMELPHC